MTAPTRFRSSRPVDEHGFHFELWDLSADGGRVRGLWLLILATLATFPSSWSGPAVRPSFLSGRNACLNSAIVSAALDGVHVYAPDLTALTAPAGMSLAANEDPIALCGVVS